MTVFSDLDNRVNSAPFDRTAYEQRLPACRAVAERVLLVHVTGRGRAFETTASSSSHEIPTSVDTQYYSDETRRAERLLGLPPSSYLYAGRAHESFGNVALGFAAGCEAAHSGSATPFDTGGLMHPDRHINVRLTPDDGEPQRAEYTKSSEIPLERWRDVFARVLAAYFDDPVVYWHGRPRPWDPEGLYELNADWRAWTFEVRFYEPHSILDRAAWCGDEMVMNALRRSQDAQELAPPGDEPTDLDRFLAGPPALEPEGTPEFCDRLEQWVRQQVGL
jgi:hypothetical protein